MPLYIVMYLRGKQTALTGNQPGTLCHLRLAHDPDVLRRQQEPRVLEVAAAVGEDGAALDSADRVQHLLRLCDGVVQGAWHERFRGLLSYQVQHRAQEK